MPPVLRREPRTDAVIVGLGGTASVGVEFGGSVEVVASTEVEVVFDGEDVGCIGAEGAAPF